MKKITILSLICMISITTSAQSKYIQLHNGEEIEKHAFLDSPSLHFIDGNWCLKLNGKTTQKSNLTKITFENYKAGDANLDAVVDVADITSVASFILAKKPDGFLKDAADANEDRTIDVADITAIASKILTNK